jgi:hypothetical protein
LVTDGPACEQDHHLANRNVEWDSILASQRGPWRHKCAACAYEIGYRDAIADVTRRIAGLFEEEEGRFPNL